MYASNEGPGQPMYLLRLIRAFLVCLQNQWLLYIAPDKRGVEYPDKHFSYFSMKKYIVEELLMNTHNI